MSRILYILHAYSNRGGTEEHTRLLAKAIGATHEVFIASVDRDRILLLKGADEVVWFPAPRIPWPCAPYESKVHHDVLNNILLQVKPDIVHVQHSLHWHLGVLDQLLDSGLPVVLTLHDYFFLTPQFTMLGVSDPKVTLSAQYSRFHFGEDITGYLAERRARLQTSISRLARVVTPSRYVADIHGEIFPREYTVIPHGIIPFAPQPKPRWDGLRFGYVGSLLPQKGYESLLLAFERLRTNHPDISLHVYGAGDGVPPPRGPGVTAYGSFAPADVPLIMSTFDVGVIPSVFAESFCLVLSELWHAGRPVAASRIGALAERIEEGRNGRLFHPGDVASLQEALDSFIRDESWREWTLPAVRGVDEMAREYLSLYSELSAA